MSRAPFWLPPGAQSRHIPKVRFDGVEPGSPEAHALAQAFGPVIRQFYLKMATQHALGIVDQSKGQRQFGDGLHMSYLNQFGQETVRVRVAPQVREKVLKPKLKFRPNHLILDLQIPRASTYLYAYARRRRSGARLASVADLQVDEGASPDAALTINGSAIDGLDDEGWYRMVFSRSQFGDSTIETLEPQHPVVGAQLFVDLTDAVSEPEVLIDLYVQGRQVPLIYEFFELTWDQTAGYADNSDPDSQGAYPTILGILVGSPTGLVVADPGHDAEALYEMVWREFAHHNPQFVGEVVIPRPYGSTSSPRGELSTLNADGTLTGLGVDGTWHADTEHPAEFRPVDFWGSDRALDPPDLTGEVCNLYGELYYSDPLADFTGPPPQPWLSDLAPEEHYNEGDRMPGVRVRSSQWRNLNGDLVGLPQLGSFPVEIVDHHNTPDTEFSLVGEADRATLNNIAYFGTIACDLERGTLAFDPA